MRRAFAILVILALYAEPIGTLALGARVGSGSEPVGLGLVVVAVLIGALNVYLSFIRPALARRANPSMEGYRNVSVVPLFGNLLALSGALVGFRSMPCAVLALVSLVIDTGGWPWFVVWTWRDRSLWK